MLFYDLCLHASASNSELTPVAIFCFLPPVVRSSRKARRFFLVFFLFFSISSVLYTNPFSPRYAYNTSSYPIPVPYAPTSPYSTLLLLPNRLQPSQLSFPPPKSPLLLPKSPTQPLHLPVHTKPPWHFLFPQRHLCRWRQ